MRSSRPASASRCFRRRYAASWLACLALLAAPLHADLDAVRAEPNLERRAERAVDNANLAVDAARKAYQEAQDAGFTAAVEEIRDSVRLCQSSLVETGKNPSRRPRSFKRAELRIRELMRRIKGLHDEVGVDDKPKVDAVLRDVAQVHEELLLGIMRPKK